VQQNKASRTATNSCPDKYKQNYSVIHIKNKEKSIDTIKRLKAFSVEKFTFNGRKFHTSTILSAKYLLRVLLTHLGLYSL